VLHERDVFLKQENLLVCVTKQKACERLIQKAVELNGGSKNGLYVLHVAKTGWNFLDTQHEGEALQYLFNVAKSAGANLTMLKSDDVIDSIVRFARENGIKHLIIGQSPEDNASGGFYYKLKSRLTNVNIIVVPPGE